MSQGRRKKVVANSMNTGPWLKKLRCKKRKSRCENKSFNKIENKKFVGKSYLRPCSTKEGSNEQNYVLKESFVRRKMRNTLSSPCVHTRNVCVRNTFGSFLRGMLLSKLFCLHLLRP